MKRAILFLLFCGVCLAQVIAPKPGQLNNLVQMTPGAIPTMLTCLVGPASTCLLVTTQTTVYLCAADLLASGQNITIKDGQATPVPWLYSATALTGNFSFNSPVDSGCRAFPYGLYVLASGSGATGSFTIKY